MVEKSQGSKSDQSLYLKRERERKTRENEIIESDRISLCEQANRFIESIVAKQTLPKLSGVTFDDELTGEETKTYNAALDYLGRQFSAGYKESETIAKRTETETELENETFPDPSLTRSSDATEET